MAFQELAESTIKGAFDFAYDVLRSLWLITISRARGALRVWSRWYRHRKYRVGPRTYQMISCVLVAIAIRQVNYASDTAGSLARYALSESRELTVEVAHSAIVAIGLFALTDLWIWGVVRSERRPVAGRQMERQRGLLRYALSTALFCVSTPAAISALVRILLPDRSTPTALAHLSTRGSRFRQSAIDYLWDHQWLIQLFLAALITLCVLTPALLRSRRRNSIARSPSFEFRHRRSWWILVLPLAVIFYACINAPDSYLLRRPDIWIEQALPDLMKPASFDVTKLRCNVSSDGTIRVVALFNNDSSDTFGVDMDSLGVVLTEWTSMLVTDDSEVIEVKGPPSKVIRPLNLDEHGMLVIPSKTATALSLVYDKPGLSQANVSSILMWLEASTAAQQQTWEESPACHLRVTAIDTSDGREIQSEDSPDKHGNRAILTEGSISIAAKE